MLTINKGQRERRERKQVLFKGKNQTQQKRVPKSGQERKYQCKSRMRHSAVKSKEKGNTGNNDG